MTPAVGTVPWLSQPVLPVKGQTEGPRIHSSYPVAPSLQQAIRHARSSGAHCHPDLEFTRDFGIQNLTIFGCLAMLLDVVVCLGPQSKMYFSLFPPTSRIMQVQKNRRL